MLHGDGVLVAGRVFQGDQDGHVRSARHGRGIIDAAGGEPAVHLDIVGRVGFRAGRVVEGALERLRVIEHDGSGQGRRAGEGDFRHRLGGAAQQGEAHQRHEGPQPDRLVQPARPAGREEQVRGERPGHRFLGHGNRGPDAVAGHRDRAVRRIQETVVGGLHDPGGAEELRFLPPAGRREDVGRNGARPVHRKGGHPVAVGPPGLDRIVFQDDLHAGVAQHAVRLVERAGSGQPRGESA